MKNEDNNSLNILINQAKTGDKLAFDYLYNELYNPLYRYVLSKTYNKDLAKDICQEVFIKWYNSLDTYEIKMKPLSYLIMIATRLLINNSKKKSSIYLPDEAEEFIADENYDIINDLDLSIEIDKIKLLFEELNDKQRDVLMLRYINDLDTESIGNSLEISIDNVRQIESRALRKIKDLYKTRYGKDIGNKS